MNLDLPQADRWTEIGEQYADKSFLLVNYLRSNLPPGWLKPLEKIAGDIVGFFADYGEEMQGYARALNITDGDVVMINLVYQLERLGLQCDSWNNTGPVNPALCDRNNENYGGFTLLDEDDLAEEGPGQCTSFVAATPEGKIYHGRNLDWNLQDTLKSLIINVRYEKGGETIYHGTTVIGFVGIIHAVKPGAFAWSLDARRKGGNIPINLLGSLLLDGTRTPEQNARWAFENADTFDNAVTMMGNTAIVNPVYYIISGVKYPEGAVLARDRQGVVHDWRMDDEVTTPGVGTQANFWVGVTNYDLNMPVPPADERSTPMTDNLNALQGKDFDDSDIWDVLKTWPTFNTHTDIGAVVDVAEGTFDVVIWMDHGSRIASSM